MSLKKATYKITATASVLSFGGMIACVILQVFSRFFMESTPAWTEELSRLLFIYSIAFGIAIAFKNDDLVKLDMISRYGSQKLHKLLDKIVSLLIVFFGLAILVFSIDFVKSGLNETSPAMQFKMIYAFLAIPILMLNIVFFSLESIFKSNGAEG